MRGHLSRRAVVSIKSRRILIGPQCRRDNLTLDLFVSGFVQRHTNSKSVDLLARLPARLQAKSRMDLGHYSLSSVVIIARVIQFVRRLRSALLLFDVIWAKLAQPEVGFEANQAHNCLRFFLCVLRRVQRNRLSMSVSPWADRK